MNAIPHDPTGWIWQEKHDGVFCRWTGTAYLSRTGHQFRPPREWMIGMPDCMVDGELWCGRGGFDELVSAIQRRRDRWDGVRFVVFDVPVLRVPFLRRIAMLGALEPPAHVIVAESKVCLSADDLDAQEADIVAGGGEGAILRHPDSCWKPGGYTKVKRLHRDLDRSVLD